MLFINGVWVLLIHNGKLLPRASSGHSAALDSLEVIFGDFFTISVVLSVNVSFSGKC